VLHINRNIPLKANSHIPCRSHTAPMPFPCHAVPLRVYIVSFQFDLHSAAVFDSHMPCRSHAVLKAISQGHGRTRYESGMRAAWKRHGICELASAVQRRHVGDLPTFGFFGYHVDFPKVLTRSRLVVRIFPSTTRTFTKDTALS
jgi:hypothetical protein